MDGWRLAGPAPAQLQKSNQFNWLNESANLLSNGLSGKYVTFTFRKKIQEHTLKNLKITKM